MTKSKQNDPTREDGQNAGLSMRKARKAQHIDLAVQYNEQISREQRQSESWADVRFVHHSLPELALSDIDLSVTVGGRTWQRPLYINAMTGGIEEAAVINRNLAQVARRHGLAIAVGSQSAALSDPNVIDTYRVVRDEMEDGIVLANVSAAVGVDRAIRAVEMLDADYLQLHLNFPQEIVMPEGDRDFRGIAANIRQIVDASPVPVIAKEVGFGMSREAYEELADAGIGIVDVSGRGGTNFAWIESRRRKDSTSLFQDWGQTTGISLLEAQEFLHRMEFLASGGLHSGIDMAKSLALGARAVGVAGSVLSLFHRGGQEAVDKQIFAWVDELRSIMLALGARSISHLQTIPVVISGRSRDWADARGINLRNLGTRTRHEM